MIKIYFSELWKLTKGLQQSKQCLFKKNGSVLAGTESCVIVTCPVTIPHLQLGWWCSSSAPGWTPKRCKNIRPHKNLYPNVHSSIIHNTHEVERIQMFTTYQWVNKMWTFHTMAFYSVTKQNEALTPTTVWMNPDGTLLSEIRPSQVTPYCMMPFIQNVPST